MWELGPIVCPKPSFPVFRIVFLPCKITVDRGFRGAYCLHHQGWSFYTAVYPRRQFWTSYSPPWELEILRHFRLFGNIHMDTLHFVFPPRAKASLQQNIAFECSWWEVPGQLYRWYEVLRGGFPLGKFWCWYSAHYFGQVTAGVCVSYLLFSDKPTSNSGLDYVCSGS
jgi:hypothetical protein